MESISKSPSSLGLPGRPLSLVLVEARDDDAARLRRHLRQGALGEAEVYRVATLAAALELLGRHHPDAVLLDPELPDSEGFATLARLRERHDEVPILVLTERDDETYTLRAIEYGAQECLCKRDASAGECVRAVRQAIERRHTRARTDELQRQLVQAQKSEALGSLAGGIAHDFNNILTSIIGYADLALSQIDEGKPLYGDLRRILEAGQRAKALTRQLLLFGRKQLFHLEPLDLRAEVKEFETLIRPLIGEQVELVCDLAPELPRIRGDSNHLQQVLMNLAINARDAMQGDGRLTILVDSATLTGGEAEAPAGTYVRLRMEDTGGGMSPEIQQRIFEPFFTTKSADQGTGLGLSTVYGTVKQLGGYISVSSEPGRGTVFSLLFPPTADQDGPVAAEERREPLPGSGTVLVVEDDDEVRGYVEAVLRRFGYRILVADGPAAARRLASGPGSIDLLLSDVVMPGHTGPELADELLRDRAGMRTLFMSGYPRRGSSPRLTVPASRLLPKPFTAAALLDAVRDAMAGRPLKRPPSLDLEGGVE